MELNDSWRLWLNENLTRGCSSEEIVKILLQHGFALESIKTEMGEYYPQVPFAALANLETVVESGVDFQALSQVAITRNPQAKILEHKGIQLFTLPGFMSQQECETTIDLMNKKLRPSEVTVSNGDDAFRTSSTCDLGFQDSDFIRDIDLKIANTIGIPIDFSEIIQGQKYAVGQQFKAHTDYFQPNTPEYKKFAGELGQRTWTFMVYLNNTARGGQTHFTAVDAEFAPTQGTAVIWNNLRTDGGINPKTIHHAKPVEQGEKYVITKWFRSRKNPQMQNITAQ